MVIILSLSWSWSGDDNDEDDDVDSTYTSIHFFVEKKLIFFKTSVANFSFKSFQLCLKLSTCVWPRGMEIETVLILSFIVFDQDYEGLWEEDGCYNTSLYQKTAGYHTYQQVSRCVSF